MPNDAGWATGLQLQVPCIQATQDLMTKGLQETHNTKGINVAALPARAMLF